MRTWSADVQMPSCEATTLPLTPADDGELVATLVRHRVASYGAPGAAADAGRTAFLYVHGFVDYWFHEHVATAVLETGIDFYALEMRRAGRSLRRDNRPNYCASLDEYYAELTAAIDVITREDGHERVLLYGHSTGGLVTALYAHEGARRGVLAGLVLNSPFFGFKVNAVQRLKLPIAVALGARFPTMSDKHAISPLYGEGLHVSRRGEWSYNLLWKPIAGFPAYFGWVRAIKHGHDRVQGGLAIGCPVLVLHSDASGGGSRWDESFRSRDIVLDVAHMRAYSGGLGPDVERREIQGAIHDVMLSPLPARTHALDTMVDWMRSRIGSGG